MWRSTYFDMFLSRNNPCFRCNIAITNFLVSNTCEIRFHDITLFICLHHDVILRKNSKIWCYVLYESVGVRRECWFVVNVICNQIVKWLLGCCYVWSVVLVSGKDYSLVFLFLYIPERFIEASRAFWRHTICMSGEIVLEESISWISGKGI